jgi:hypothetical protein
MTKVWGTTEGLCAWCNDKAEAHYTGEQAGGELVEYQVCSPCKEERV